ncbi:MAG TPA: hypothetical protein VGP22_17805 [Albitalea sp.]|jgi:hypothetical protein|nr:hypothetical protein [Albitalea sp.]
MTVFRWIIGIVMMLLAAGGVASFVIFIATGIDLWIKRAHSLRRLTWATVLFWFNLEVWRRVALIIIHW